MPFEGVCGRHQELLELTLAAHRLSARNKSADGTPNLSMQAVTMAAVGSGNYFQSIAAGLMTLGGLHGPVRQTYFLLKALLAGPEEVVGGAIAKMLLAGAKIPGWGNAFYKDGIDPAWTRVEESLFDNADPLLPGGSGKMPWLLRRIEGVLHDHGFQIHMNPAGFTAAVALIAGLPAAGAEYLLVAGRLATWTEQFHHDARRL